MHQWKFDVDDINYACYGYENETKTRLIDDLMVGFNDFFSIYTLYIPTALMGHNNAWTA